MGRTGTRAAYYRERLWPGPFAWIIALGLAGMLTWAYAAALGAPAGLLTAAITITAAVILLRLMAPLISTQDEGLRVGRALLPWTSITAARSVTAGEITALRGPGADARIYTELLPLAARTGVLVTLSDPADPHPAWLVSSRHPQRLVDAILESMGSLPASGASSTEAT